jgi:hypothetical protein
MATIQQPVSIPNRDPERSLVDTNATEPGRLAALPLCFSDILQPTDFKGGEKYWTEPGMRIDAAFPHSCGGYTSPYTSAVMDKCNMGTNPGAYLSGHMEDLYETV